MSFIGRTLGGRYKVLSLLGKGGMGVVFEAEQLDLKRRVAVKVLTPGAEHEQILRFKQEALAAAGLAHPNIVQVFDFIDGEEPLLVMELLRGQSLAALVKKTGKLAPARVVAMMTQVLSALSAAHDARIVHRDVKPENIFVCESALPYELVKVLDFGLARPLDESRHIARTRAGLALGTPAYMAPEQTRGANADVRMDVFAAGVTLYYALAGRRPFEGKTTSELVAAVRKQPPIPLDAICPDLELDLVRVVERSLSKEPESRFATARDFIEALAPFGSHVAPRAPEAERHPAPSRQDTTAGARKRMPEALTAGELTVRSPTIAIGMVAFGRFAPDGESALAVGPSGLARWTLDNRTWSSRELPPGIVPGAVRRIVVGPNAEAVLMADAWGTFVRKQGTYARVELPGALVIEGFHVDDASHMAFAGSIATDEAPFVDGVVVECSLNTTTHAIARGMVMQGVARAPSGVLVACGARGTVCMIAGGRVDAHVAGRSTLRAITPVGEGFVAVGDAGALVHAPSVTSDSVAKTTERFFVDDDLVTVYARGKLICAVGRRVHVASIDTLDRVVSLTTPGLVRDAWLGEGTIRVLLDSAAVLEGPISGL